MSSGGLGPMPITAIGAAACATTAFRVAGQLRINVVVKATLLLHQDHPMARIDPDPILAADFYGDSDPGAMGGEHLIVASDLAPYRPRADVLVYGHARAPLGKPATAVGVRLLVARAEELLIDKRLTAPRPERLDCLGPLSPRSEARRRLLNVDAALLSAPIPDLPVNFAWGYFNVAPEDQRIDFLCGDEWIGVEGMHSQIPRVQSCLPSIQGAARLYGPSPGLRAGRAIALAGDTLTIDIDRLRCWVVWRGSFALSSEDELARHHIFAGVEAPDAPLYFPASYSEPPPPAESDDQLDDLIATPRILPAVKRREDDRSETADLPFEATPQARAAPVIPFASVPLLPPREAPARPLPPATPFEGALIVPPRPAIDAGAMTLTAPLTPIHLDAEAYPPSDALPPTDPTATLATPLASEVEIGARPRPAPVLPFAVPAPKPPREAPARPLPPATPFEGALPTPPRPAIDAGAMTLMAPLTASAEPAPESPKTLGACFLAAMARAAPRATAAPSR